jgi:hypothetical protein
VSEISVSDAKEVIFSLFPQKVSTEPESAPEIIAQCRAFWQFLSREYKLKHAPGIVALLDDASVSRLRQKLADPANYGMAKSCFMMGQKAGFDMTTEEGMLAFQTLYNAKMASRMPLPPVEVDEDDEDEEANDPRGTVMDAWRPARQLPDGSAHTNLSPRERSEQRKKKRKSQKRKGK